MRTIYWECRKRIITDTNAPVSTKLIAGKLKEEETVVSRIHSNMDGIWLNVVTKIAHSYMLTKEYGLKTPK